MTKKTDITFGVDGHPVVPESPQKGSRRWALGKIAGAAAVTATSVGVAGWAVNSLRQNVSIDVGPHRVPPYKSNPTPDDWQPVHKPPKYSKRIIPGYDPDATVTPDVTAQIPSTYPNYNRKWELEEALANIPKENGRYTIKVSFDSYELAYNGIDIMLLFAAEDTPGLTRWEKPYNKTTSYRACLLHDGVDDMVKQQVYDGLKHLFRNYPVDFVPANGLEDANLVFNTGNIAVVETAVNPDNDYDGYANILMDRFAAGIQYETPPVNVPKQASYVYRLNNDKYAGYVLLNTEHFRGPLSDQAFADALTNMFQVDSIDKVYEELVNAHTPHKPTRTCSNDFTSGRC